MHFVYALCINVLMCYCFVYTFMIIDYIMNTHKGISKCSIEIKTQRKWKMTQHKQSINEVNYNAKKTKKNKI